MGELSKMTVGVTGSTGYLGSSLVAALRSRGLDVVEFRHRRGDAPHDGAVRQMDLGGPLDSDIFEGVTCLIHAAWDLRETDSQLAWNRNVEGSKRLLAAALSSGVERFIFVSSMSAYFGTTQDYGLMKLAVERAVLEANQVVVRPGLVYGNSMGGMSLTLSKLARLPVIPLFRGAQQFTLHLDDLLESLITIAQYEEELSSVIGLAHATPTPFREIMMSLAPQGDHPPRTIVVPWLPLLWLLRAAEKLHVPLPVRSDSLLGLVRPAPFVPGQDIASRLGLTFRDFAGVH
jgi:nucleoside-diphosphate-sugar epimerase